jgi:transposase
MTALLRRLGYVYKKPKLIPSNPDEISQEIFAKQYQEFMSNKSSKEAVFFIDAVHPEHNTMAAYGWMKKGEERKLLTHYGRKRLNLHGAINPETLDAFVIESSTIDSGSTIALFETLEKYYPLALTIYVILDNAGYHKSREVEKYLANSRIKTVFLPPSCPNLNLIERLWKLFKKSVLYNKCFTDFKDFRKNCVNFFKDLTKYEDELHRIMNDEFEIITVS